MECARGTVFSIVALLVMAACGDSRRPADKARELAHVELNGAPASLPLTIRSSGDTLLGFEVGTDSATFAPPRLLVRPARDTMAAQRLCGAMAQGTARPVVVDWGARVDTSRPPLAPRMIKGTTVQGIRFLLPGVDAKYVFEGLALNGQRVSLHWPVHAERAIPVDAPDSVMETAVRPSTATLDSLIRAFHVSGALAADSDAPAPAFPQPGAAVRLDGLLPRYDVTLTPPCLDVTFAVPVIARIDSRIRLAVPAHATVTATASAPDGAVRVAFEESATTRDLRTREAVPSARIIAGRSGQVTVRVGVQVVPRTQPTGQVVLVRIRAAAAGPVQP